MTNGPLTQQRQPMRILVVCTGNRARSQMAHGWLNHLDGDALLATFRKVRDEIGDYCRELVEACCR